MNIHPHTEILTSRALEQCLSLIERWAPIFPNEPTWVRREYGQPSLIVRLDGVCDDAGNFHLYEVEDRPCGIGATSCIDDHFASKLTQVRSDWPKDIVWVSDPTRPTDDVLWLGEGLSCTQAMESEALLLVRSRPEHTSYYPLMPRAISTVQAEGDKRCLAQLGLLQTLKWTADPSDMRSGYIEPALHQPLVVKPQQGTRSHRIGVYLNGTSWPYAKRGKDTVGLSELERCVRSGQYVFQPFVPPMRCEFLGDRYRGWNMIHRCFFGFSPLTREWIPMGGVWMALDSLIVHGKKETISGPLHC